MRDLLILREEVLERNFHTEFFWRGEAQRMFQILKSWDYNKPGMIQKHNVTNL